ncbi:MAG: VTT domain-containing protein [Opitutaceae bacterium]|nr:VTT domain-containing protein [Opitutaceae bacterium]
MNTHSVLPKVILGFVIAALSVGLIFMRDQFDPVLIERTIRELGPLAPVVFVALYALATVLFVPGAIFGLAGGALFGPWWGTVVNISGATMGATLAFLTARYLASNWVRQKAGGRVERLMAGVEAEGWRFVAFVRLVPFFPFNLLNYALGLTRIPLTHYVVASLVCMLPGTLAFTWLGHAGREALAGDATAVRYGLMALAILAAVAFLPRLVRRVRRTDATPWIEPGELAAHLNDGADNLVVVDVRGPDEFTGALGHIGNARNLPVDELPHRMGELEALRNKMVVLVCHTDKRSAKTAALLRGTGFPNVRVLRGGMVRWNQSNEST